MWVMNSGGSEGFGLWDAWFWQPLAIYASGMQLRRPGRGWETALLLFWTVLCRSRPTILRWETSETPNAPAFSRPKPGISACGSRPPGLSRPLEAPLALPGAPTWTAWASGTRTKPGGAWPRSSGRCTAGAAGRGKPRASRSAWPRASSPSNASCLVPGALCRSPAKAVLKAWRRRAEELLVFGSSAAVMALRLVVAGALCRDLQ